MYCLAKIEGGRIKNLQIMTKKVIRNWQMKIEKFVGKTVRLKIFSWSLKFYWKQGEISETEGNTSLPQRGWTPLTETQPENNFRGLDLGRFPLNLVVCQAIMTARASLEGVESRTSPRKTPTHTTIIYIYIQDIDGALMSTQ